MLYLIGLGLGQPKDITVAGLEAAVSCDVLYLEHYTSQLVATSPEELSAFFRERGAKEDVVLADRELVESGDVLARAHECTVGILVVGDPFSATTHSDLVVRCHEKGIPVEAIHNTSIMTAVGATGLSLYRVGQTISLCFWTDTWRPTSWYDRIAANRREGLHTLCLLDIKMKEKTDDELVGMKKTRSPWDPPEPPKEAPKPRFMTINQACQQLLSVMEERGDECAYDRDTICVGCARMGSAGRTVVAGTLASLCDVDFGGPLHSLVVCGTLEEHEEEHLQLYYTEAMRATYEHKKLKRRMDLGLEK